MTPPTRLPLPPPPPPLPLCSSNPRSLSGPQSHQQIPKKRYAQVPVLASCSVNPQTLFKEARYQSAYRRSKVLIMDPVMIKAIQNAIIRHIKTGNCFMFTGVIPNKD